MSAQLKAAVEILTELGWENVDTTNVLTLPLGTADQRKIIKHSLKSGTWMGQGWSPDDPLKEHGEVSSKNALVYLLRIGFLPSSAFTSDAVDYLDKPTLLAVLEAAEKPFAETIIHHNYSSVIRFGEHEPTRLGATIVQVIHSKNLPLPATIEYLKDWAALAETTLTGKEPRRSSHTAILDEEVIKHRFVEHLTLGVELNTPATGPFSTAFTEGLHRGWVTREKALDLAIQGLTLATRPGDRKRWTEILTVDVQATPEELLPHAQQLHQAVSTGEGLIVEKIAVPLIPHLGLKELTDYALPALYAKTAKALTLVLKTLATLTPHPDVTAALSPRIVELSGHGSLPIQKLATALATSWEIPQYEGADATPNTTFTPYIPAPPVWNVERFAPKPADLAAKLAEGDLDDPFNSTLASEELIHLIVEGAYNNPEETRRALSGVTERHEKGLIYTWVTGKKINERLREFHGNYFGPLSRLGKIPCLLARPSFVDRSILVPDLIERLERYVDAGAKAIASDVELAITRLDVAGIDVPATQEILRKFSIPISVSQRKDVSYTVGEVLAAYIADPFVDPGLRYLDEYAETTISVPETLWQFPELFDGDKQLGGGSLSSFPLFGDVVAVAFIFADEANSDVDHYCDQLSHRRSPLEPGMAMNLLSLYRAGNPATKERAFNAAVTAFTRGLLRPNVADIRYLDWRDHPPTHLAQLIDTTRELADAGLLSVCWPLWEHILDYSHTQPKPLTGIHHVAHAMADYAPSITHALTENQAPREVAHVPALRTLAESKAKNKAVTYAKEAVQHLPVLTKDSATQPASITQSITWSATIIPNTPDDTEFIANPETGGLYPITVKPSGFEQPLTTRYGTSIDFSTTGKLQVTTPDDVWSYLFWDSETASLLAEERTDAYFDLPDPTAHKEHIPFVVPDSFVAVMLAHLASGERYQAKRQLPRLFRSGHIGSPAIEAAMRKLLRFPDFDPGKALALLHEKPELIEYLWPMLTEPLAHAATLPTTPKWLNAILDAVIFHQDTLKHHTPSHIPAEKWEQLSALAHTMTKRPVSKTAKTLTLLQKTFANINPTPETTQTLGPQFLETSSHGDATSRNVSVTAGLAGDTVFVPYTEVPPFDPAIVKNLLILYRDGNAEIWFTSLQAAFNVFTQGLKDLSVADEEFFTWDGKPPATLAKLTDITRELADSGLLSVCWPLWDYILDYSRNLPKPLTGIHHVARAMADYAPSVAHAVVEKQAEGEAAQAPALRALAASTARSQAVGYAKQAVALLPTTNLAAPTLKPAVPVQAWSTTITPDTPDHTDFIPHPETGGGLFPLTLKPQGFRKPLTVHLHRSDSLSKNGKLEVSTPADVWKVIYWDAATASMKTGRSTYGDDEVETDFVIPDSFVAALLAQLSCKERHAALYLLPELFHTKHVGAPAIETAMRTLLRFPDFNPGTALYLLNKTPKYIEHLWPMLTEPLAHAATLSTTPKWLNAILDAVIFHQDTLKHHTPSHIPAEKWEPLSALAQTMTKKSAAKTKVDQLNRFFHP